MRRPLLGSLLLFLVCSANGQHHGPSAFNPDITPAQWQEDLAFFAANAPKIHFRLYHTLSPEALAAGLDALGRRLPLLPPEQRGLAVAELVAAIGDGHSLVPPTAIAPSDKRVLPLTFYEFDDGLYIVGAAAQYKSAVRARVLDVGGVSSEHLLQRVEPMVARDNAMTVRERRPFYLRFPAVLQRAGAAQPGKPVMLRLEKEGQLCAVEVSPEAADPAALLPAAFLPKMTADWIAAPLPAFMDPSAPAYAMEFLPRSNALYVAYNRSGSDPQLPIKKFADQLEAEIVRRKPSRVVLDLRLNAGGEGFYNRYLVSALVRALDPSRGNQFYVLIGRRTFSAGTALVADLEKYTNLTLVGEKSGGRPNSYGNHAVLLLPNSNLPILLAPTYFLNATPADTRDAFEPKLAVPVTAADFLVGRDRALEAAISQP
jgi:hypothetical protein